MYSLRFSKTYGFGIMEKNNLKQVLEDKFYADDKMFCIADGVTRDLVDGTPIRYPETLEEAKEIIKKYPNPSGAAKAAEICVDDVINYLKKEEITDKSFREALEIANSDIKKINQGRKINYISEDEYCCAAVGGVISNDELNCFSIGDSGIRVYDEDYNIIFDSLTYLKCSIGIFCNVGKRIFPRIFCFNNKYFRKYLRKHNRNNLWLKRTKQNNIGVLNGKREALAFFMTYKISLKNAKYIIAFSDGALNSINDKEQVKKVICNPENIRDLKEEKTLIIYEKQ